MFGVPLGALTDETARPAVAGHAARTGAARSLFPDSFAGLIRFTRKVGRLNLALPSALRCLALGISARAKPMLFILAQIPLRA